MTYKRRCPNWLETFVDSLKPVSESPESMLLFSGLFTLSSALRRHVCIPKRLLGQYEVNPSMFIVFIAPPGVAKKSTTSGIAEELLRHIPDARKAPTVITLQKFVDIMADDKGDGSLYMISSELSTTINKSGPEFFDTLTDVFDGKKTLDDSTLTRGSVIVDNPCINFIAATTPAAVNNGAIPAHILSGGFGSRTIFISEFEPRQRRLFYDNIEGLELLDAQKEDLIADLQHIASSVWGDFDITDEGKAFLEEYYRQISFVNTGESRKIDGYFTRKHVHILKIAMIVHISYSDELVITLDDLLYAIQILAQVEPKMLAAFKSLGKNKYTADIMGIIDYMKQNKRVTRTALVEEFSASADPHTLNQLILGVQAMGKIIWDDSDGIPVYIYTG
jgi:hypothetical protein